MSLTKKEKIALLNKKAKPVNPDAKWMEIAKWNEDHSFALEDYVIIAMRILSTLKRRKMTQKELAKQLNVTPQALTRIMKGRQNLTLNKIRQIEKVLDISLININRTEENQTLVRTKMVPVQVHYNISKSAYQGDISILKPGGKREEKKSIQDLSVAS